jgi:hypothetical protein
MQSLAGALHNSNCLLASIGTAYSYATADAATAHILVLKLQ